MSLHALTVLPFLLPDVRVKADSSKILYLAQVKIIMLCTYVLCSALNRM